MTPPIERFPRERWTAGIIGLGYVGLLLAMTAGPRRRRLDVLVSARRPHGRQSHVGDVSDEELKERWRPAPSSLTTSTPSAKRMPPSSRPRRTSPIHIEAAARTVSIARPGQLVSLGRPRSGTTEDIIVPARAPA